MIMLSKNNFKSTCIPCEGTGERCVNWLDGNSKLRNKHFEVKSQAILFMQRLEENDYNMLITLNERAA